MRQKLIVIIGPTASGKSELAVKLARRFNGEIISADSRQIYRGLNVGTGKVSGKWRHNSFKRRSPLKRIDGFVYKGIPHHCIDSVSPKKIFSAAEFKKCAEAAIKDIASRGKIPILTGGTGFWIDAVVYDFQLPPVPPDPKLRKKLKKKSTEELLSMLKKLDPERAANIEKKNPRRLIRAIEIAGKLGKVPKIKKNSPYQTLWIGLAPPYEIRPRKIAVRAKKMIKGGLLRELRMLLYRGVSRKRIKEFGFEYAAALDCLDKKTGEKTLLERLIRETIRYARRQMVWWKRNRQIRWIKKPEEALRITQLFLRFRKTVSGAEADPAVLRMRALPAPPARPPLPLREV